MFRTITTKTLYEKRWMLLFWSLGVLFTAWLTMILYPSFSQSGGFDQIVKNLPQQLQSLIGNPDSLKTVGGFANSQIFALRLPLLTIIMAISLFTGLTSGDEEQGTLQTLLALPVSRVRVLSERFLAGMIILGIACLAGWVGMEIGLVTIHTSYSAGALLVGTFYCWLATMAFGAVAFCLGAVTGKKGITVGIASLFAFLSFFISSFSDSVEKLKPLVKISLFHIYTETNVVVDGLNHRNVGIMLATSILLFSIGLFWFNRRDLRN